MRALVVYESMFGNTRDVALAVAEGLARAVSVDTAEVSAAPPPGAYDLVVAGGPTHAFGLSRASTRESARAQGATAGSAIGLREWLDALPRGTARAAAFDTRVRKPRVPGSAARKAARRLHGLGYSLVAPAETFWVGGSPGPLLDGELDRARRWGESLAAALAIRTREGSAR